HVAVVVDGRARRSALGRHHLVEGPKMSTLDVARARRAALGTHLLAVRVDKVRATIAEERRHEAYPLFAPDDRDDVVAALDGGMRALAHSSPSLIVGTLGAAFGRRSRISMPSTMEGRLGDVTVRVPLTRRYPVPPQLRCARRRRERRGRSVRPNRK